MPGMGKPTVNRGGWVYDLASQSWVLVSPQFIIPMLVGITSTGFGPSTPKAVGAYAYNSVNWPQLSPQSVISFHMLLETTNAANPVTGSLIQYSGIGAPATVITVNTGSLITAELSGSVSSFFVPSANPGIFKVNLNLGTTSGTDVATTSGAWLQIVP